MHKPRDSWQTCFYPFLGIAFGVASLCLMYFALGIAPGSERITVNGAEITVDWKPEHWITGHTGAYCYPPYLLPDSGWDGMGQERIYQDLLKLEYSTYFGQPTFRTHISVVGHRHADWKSYVIHPFVTGGGSTAGGTVVNCRFDETTNSIRVHITQYLNSSRIAKRTQITFIHDGKRFVATDNELDPST
ncbi:MAG: hypothetical protein JWN70_5083 [Planctomycetaceae bacterium]|nr:hypothetical protein [Planctomycetaceae bacterium]